LDGVGNETEIAPTPEVTVSEVGVSGVVIGRAVPVGAELDAPGPAALTALSRIEYVVPFVKPEIVIGDVVEEVVVHVSAPSVEY
jgi:hypothetical protein